MVYGPWFKICLGVWWCVWWILILDTYHHITYRVFNLLCGNQSMYSETTSQPWDWTLVHMRSWFATRVCFFTALGDSDRIDKKLSNFIVQDALSFETSHWQSLMKPSWSIMIHHDPSCHSLLDWDVWESLCGSNRSKSGIFRNCWKSWVPSSKEELIIYPLKHEYGTSRDHRSEPGAPRWCKSGFKP